MTTRHIDTTTGEIIEGDERELTRQSLLTILKAGWAAKQAKSAAEADYRRIMGTNAEPSPLREWSNAHPDEELEDGETGLYLERSEAATGGERMDLMTMARDVPNVVLRLAELGLLKLDGTAWKAHAKDFAEADEARRFIMPPERTTKLEIKRRRD